MSEPAHRDPRTGHLSTELALRLREAGLAWTPGDGDRFVVPDRDMDDQVFTVSHMVIEARDTPAGAVMAFNGTTEWALDAIMQHDVIWLPREDQLREALGGAFISLHATTGGMRCVIELGGAPVEHDGATAEEAYGRALLHLLLHG